MTPRFRLLAAAPALLALAGSASAQLSSTNRTPSYSSRSSSNSSSSNRNYSGQGNGSSSSGGVRQYPSNTLLGDATIQIDPESRSLIVVTDEETHSEVAKVIDNLDHPKPQVLIRVVFIEVSLDKSLDVGVEGSYTFKIGNSGLLSGTAATSGSSILGASSVQTLFGLGQQTTGSFMRLASDNWAATLTALSNRGNLHVLSRPTIMARNNQEAVIVVGQEVPFVTNSQITSTGQTINTIQYQDVGIILRVTPFISSDKSVEMIVAPEISAVSNQTVKISDTVSAPIIDKRSAETVVVTPNGQTVVIAGLMQKQQQTNVQKIPILGDVPILGFPFRHTVKSETRSELLIFLTPYIVENPRAIKQATEAAVNPRDLNHNGFPADQILQDLDTLKLPTTPDPSGAPASSKKAPVKKKGA